MLPAFVDMAFNRPGNWCHISVAGIYRFIGMAVVTGSFNQLIDFLRRSLYIRKIYLMVNRSVHLIRWNKLNQSEDYQNPKKYSFKCFHYYLTGVSEPLSVFNSGLTFVFGVAGLEGVGEVLLFVF